jgi:osmotically-inducible protein OsmY
MTMVTLFRNRGSETEDGRIRDDVRRQITWQADIQSEEIGIQVKAGAVFLEGRVETRLERLEAENAANAADGVFSVVNGIQVIPRRPHSDGEIQGDVNASLRAVLCVLEKMPTVTIEDGIAVLEGNVRWRFQRTSAERAADAVIGVRGVRNRIEVGRPAVSVVNEAYRPGPNATPALLLLGRGGSLPLGDDRPVLAAAS